MCVTSPVGGQRNTNTEVFFISKILEDPLGSPLSLARLRRPAAPLFQIPLLADIQKVQAGSRTNRRCSSPRRRRAWLSA